MAYSSLTAVVLNNPKFPQTTTASGWSAVSVVITKHISRCDGIIDGKCARRYSLPFSPVPPMIRSISEDMVTAKTMISFYSQDNQNRTEWLDEFDGTMDLLNEIMEGKMDLVDTSGSVVAVRDSQATDIIQSNHMNHQPFFAEDEPEDWDFSRDLLDDVESNR